MVNNIIVVWQRYNPLYLCAFTKLLVITEAIMDLHQRIDSIKTIASAVVVSDPAKVAYAFQQITKEIIISKFLISAIFFCHRAREHHLISQAFQFCSG